jgi:membrane protease YdiL (CAAX protease family)
VSSLLFGLAHFGGGFEYIFLAFIAGLFYGAVYLKTNKIESAILLHFFINFAHLLLLSYPYALL